MKKRIVPAGSVGDFTVFIWYLLFAEKLITKPFSSSVSLASAAQASIDSDCLTDFLEVC